VREGGGKLILHQQVSLSTNKIYFSNVINARGRTHFVGLLHFNISVCDFLIFGILEKALYFLQAFRMRITTSLIPLIYNNCTLSIVNIMVMVFNPTFDNISVISWWSVLLVEETEIPRENHRPATSH
jgi:hypothetical protein